MERQSGMRELVPKHENPLDRDLHPDIYQSVEEQKEIAHELVQYWYKEDPADGPEFAAKVAKDIMILEPSREAIPFIFRDAYNTITEVINEKTGESNIETIKTTIKTLIDIIRSIQDDPDLRMVLFAIMAHDVQESHLRDLLSRLDDERHTLSAEEREALLHEYDSALMKRKAFEEIAHFPTGEVFHLEGTSEEDISGLTEEQIEERFKNETKLVQEPNPDRIADTPEEQQYRNIARSIINPSEKSQEFLQDFDPDNFTLPANILSDEELLSALGQDGEDEKSFATDLMRLPNPKMTSEEVLRRFALATGQVPNVSLTILFNKKRIYIDMDRRRTLEAIKIGRLYREKAISLEERTQQLEAIVMDFVETLNLEQQDLATDPDSIGLELRFVTTRNSRDPEEVEQFLEQLKALNDEIDEAIASADRIRTLDPDSPSTQMQEAA